MSEHAGVGVLPFDGMGLYEQPRPPRLVFKMPRVVPDQKAKFESDELFRRLSRESEVRYTGYRDRPIEERQVRFQNGCREGHTEIAFAATGTNLQLVFGNASGNYPVDPNDCDFDKEHGKKPHQISSILQVLSVDPESIQKHPNHLSNKSRIEARICFELAVGVPLRGCVGRRSEIPRDNAFIVPRNPIMLDAGAATLLGGHHDIAMDTREETRRRRRRRSIRRPLLPPPSPRRAIIFGVGKF
ncbi:Protein big brother [Cyphomyrmex costatus]|uniref:Protein big brother n=1 Tax=Cyphomyrmex costatus TaxID=456900 RepID=A0A151I7N0_9HYME|nr:Protein big brother [Cyphomyrmex costatus]